MPSITIDMNPAQVQRAAQAVGVRLNLLDGARQPRPATAAELKRYMIAQLRNTVLDEERRASQPPDIPFEPI